MCLVDVPVVLIWKAQEAARDTPFLKNVEKAESFSLRQAEVVGVVNDQSGGAELQDALRRRRIPATVVLPSVPECAVKLGSIVSGWSFVSFQSQEKTHLALHEPKFFSRDLGIRHKCSIVGDKSLELAAQRTALNPVDHKATVASTGSNAVVGIDKVKVISDVFPSLHKVFVGIAACLVVSEMNVGWEKNGKG